LDWEWKKISKILIVGVWITAGVSLFTPYEAVLETILALLLIEALRLSQSQADEPLTRSGASAESIVVETAFTWGLFSRFN
jgi:hypothetical protein